MINIIVISALLLSGFIGANETSKETINDIVVKTILSTTTESIYMEETTTPAEQRNESSGDTKASNTEDLNATVESHLSSEDTTPLSMSSTEESMEPFEYIEQKPSGIGGSRFKPRINCRCKIFSRCVASDVCLRHRKSL